MRRGIIQVRLARPSRLAATFLGLLASGCDRPVEPAPPPPPALSVADRDLARAAAEKALDDGRFADAERIARALDERAGDAAAAELLGRSLAALGRRDEAADAYARAAGRDPTNAALAHAAATVAESAGRVDAALAGYARAIELEPDAASWRLFRANAFLRLGRPDEATPDLDALLVLAPREGWTHAVRAEWLLQSGDPEAAAAAAAEARGLDPDELAFRLIESRALRAADRPGEAAERLSALAPELRANEAVAEELARAWLAAGRPDRAAEAWERAAAFAPACRRCALEAALARIAADDLVRARHWAESLRLQGATAEAERIDEAIRARVAR